MLFFSPEALPVVGPVMEALDIGAMAIGVFGGALVGEGFGWWDVPWIK